MHSKAQDHNKNLDLFEEKINYLGLKVKDLVHQGAHVDWLETHKDTGRKSGSSPPIEVEEQNKLIREWKQAVSVVLQIWFPTKAHKQDHCTRK